MSNTLTAIFVFSVVAFSHLVVLLHLRKSKLIHALTVHQSLHKVETNGAMSNEK